MKLSVILADRSHYSSVYLFPAVLGLKLMVIIPTTLLVSSPRDALAPSYLLSISAADLREAVDSRPSLR